MGRCNQSPADRGCPYESVHAVADVPDDTVWPSLNRESQFQRVTIVIHVVTATCSLSFKSEGFGRQPSTHTRNCRKHSTSQVYSSSFCCASNSGFARARLEVDRVFKRA